MEKLRLEEVQKILVSYQKSDLRSISCKCEKYHQPAKFKEKLGVAIYE